MDAAIEGREWWTRARDRRQAVREEGRARRCCAKSPKARTSAAIPGMQFDTTIHKWHTCKGTDRQNSTNPVLANISSSTTRPAISPR